MIVIRVELWRKGNPHDVKVLGVAKIANVSRFGADSKRGDYKAVLYGGRSGRVVQRRVSVAGFPRLRLTAWDLLLRVLREAYGERNR
jgi:hypothetical protein